MNTGDSGTADPWETSRRIAEALQRAGVRVRVAPDENKHGTYSISGIPRGRRPTVERVMAILDLPWSNGTK